MHQKRAESGGHQAKSPLCVCGCRWARLGGHGGFPAGQQSALNWPAVPCSFCCPKAHWATRLCQKEGKRHSHATLHAVTKPAFTRGSIQRRPTGSRITGETICSNQGWASAPSSVFLWASTTTLVQPDPSSLAQWWPHGPKEVLMRLVYQPGCHASGLLTVTCGLADGALREAEQIRQRSPTSVNLCGAEEGNHKAVESNGCFHFFSECKDRCTQSAWRHNETTEWRQLCVHFCNWLFNFYEWPTFKKKFSPSQNTKCQ